MDEQQLENLAREYVDEVYNGDTDFTEEAEQLIHWLSKRFCLVDKKRVEELDLAFRAKQYDMIVLNSEDFAYLFPEIAKETEV